MSNASERILVTGAGVAGGEVLRQLAAANRTACALVRNPKRAEPFRKLGVKLIEGDFANKESWKRALDGVAAVFNITVAHPGRGCLERCVSGSRQAKRGQARRATVGHERVAVVTCGISSANERMR